MFIDNITEAGGHSRTHHDMGLTAELSMGHRNNLTRNACAPSLPLPAPTTSTFSHTNNMKIIRPEDYQGNHSSAGTAAASAAASAAVAAAASAAASASAATAANASSTKPPAMCPMYTTFRMQHQPKRKGNDADLSRVAPSKKRAKIDAPEKDKKHMDDAASDCDSGVDVSNEHVDGKKATVATADDANGYYSVLDHYLDMLPMPSEQNDAASGFLDANALAPLPLDVDPIFGYPTLDFYSSNGFYYDDAHVHQPVSYPTVLTSGFDPVQAAPTTVPNDTMYIDPASTLVHAFAQPVMDPSAAEFIDPDAVNAFKTQPLVIQLNQMSLPDANVPLVAAPKEEDQYLTFEDDHPCMELDPETTTNALDPSFVLSLGGIHPSSFGELMPV
ncbi:hypothetical protein BC940DRAFT_173805 [Gongronella butleri]|nr:hypothetical protein BC940DRAFT_173805 [Gongronella butleri]